MNYLKNSRFSISKVCLIILISISFSLKAAVRDDLYKEGLAAYNSKNYTEALKKLYAFYILNEEALASHEEIKKGIEERVRNAETILAASTMFSNMKMSANGILILEPAYGFSIGANGKTVQELLKSTDIKIIEQNK